MIYGIGGLAIFAILLLCISPFARDPYKSIREEIDQLSMQQLQEIYVIKKKLKVLEEELLITDDAFQPAQSTEDTGHSFDKADVHDIIKNQVWSLAQQGVSLDQIAKQSSLAPKQVEAIIAEKLGGRK